MPPARKRPRSVADLARCAWEDPQLGALAKAIGNEVAALHGLQAAAAAPGSLAQLGGAPTDAAGRESNAVGTGGGRCEAQRGLQKRGRRGRGLCRSKRPRFELAAIGERLAQCAACAAARLDLPGLHQGAAAAGAVISA